MHGIRIHCVKLREIIIVSLLGYGRKRVRDQLRDDVIRVIRPVEGEIVYSIVRVSWRHLWRLLYELGCMRVWLQRRDDTLRFVINKPRLTLKSFLRGVFLSLIEFTSNLLFSERCCHFEILNVILLRNITYIRSFKRLIILLHRIAMLTIPASWMNNQYILVFGGSHIGWDILLKILALRKILNRVHIIVL